MDHGLSASLDAGDVVTHWVHAGLTWVDLDNDLKSRLATLKLLLPVLALRFAFLEHLWLWVLALVQLGLDVARGADMWSQV